MSVGFIQGSGDGVDRRDCKGFGEQGWGCNETYGVTCGNVWRLE